MKKAEVAEFIVRARKKGVPFGEMGQYLLAAVPTLTASELTEAYRRLSDELAPRSHRRQADRGSGRQDPATDHQYVAHH